MLAGPQAAEHGLSVGCVPRLAEDSLAVHYQRIGGQHEAATFLLSDDEGLGRGQGLGHLFRLQVRSRWDVLIQVRDDQAKREAEVGKEGAAAG